MTKLGFISDIHGNIDALEAVLARLDKEGCELILCLGDIVGYGAAPEQCVNLIREREMHCVLGNHDEYVTLLMDPRVERLRDEVRHSVAWTQAQLSMDNLKWLAKLSNQIDAELFGLCHGAYGPNPWAYCLDEETFKRNFQHQPCQLAFCGHSHKPLIAVDLPDRDLPMVDYIRHCKVPEDNKVMINIGSVGQPRDNDPRACAVIYDADNRELQLIRVEYDIEAAQKKIRAASLPERFAARLAIGR
ncbi:MAG: metallophosphoesterase family protein [Lentisphaeria bacterium]|jgi:predicted phosphodiesterase